MSLNRFGVLFRVDALPSTGFGHAARCLQLARLCKGLGPLAFQGSFSQVALARIEAERLDITLLRPDEEAHARVGVIDRMSEPTDMNAYDSQVTATLRATCHQLLYICSGTILPPAAPDVHVIGYQPADVAPLPDHVRWGLEYAPVSASLLESVGPERDRESVLVALGGHPDDGPLRALLGVIASLPEIIRVHVLLSPVMGQRDEAYRVGAHQTLRCHQNVPSVAPLLGQAGLVVASFGNLVYEGLALGAPLCVVGQKDFQVTLAEAMAVRGLVTCGGNVLALNAAALKAALELTLTQRDELSQLGPETVDGLGLERIANIIEVLAS
jgi:spore coat polysaccharide biosynthesis predicted glycosyltransferase SpsG